MYFCKKEQGSINMSISQRKIVTPNYRILQIFSITSKNIIPLYIHILNIIFIDVHIIILYYIEYHSNIYFVIKKNSEKEKSLSNLMFRLNYNKRNTKENHNNPLLFKATQLNNAYKTYRDKNDRTTNKKEHFKAKHKKQLTQP